MWLAVEGARPSAGQGGGGGAGNPPRGPGRSLHASALGCSLGQTPKALAGPKRSWLCSLGARKEGWELPLSGGLSVSPLTHTTALGESL